MVEGTQSCVRLAGWSLCGSHGQLWLGSRFSLRSGRVLAMLAPGQASCQHSVVQMICNTRYFIKLICSVPAKALPMQILALANNAGKANQVISLQT